MKRKRIQDWDFEIAAVPEAPRIILALYLEGHHAAQIAGGKTLAQASETTPFSISSEFTRKPSSSRCH